jgi:branched-chain amino acid transport system ATP-binding protein
MLEVSELVVRYGKAVVVDRVSLQVGQGGTTALLGANGAGKSSILKVISGLKQAAAGGVSFLGEDLLKLPPHRIVRLGLVQVPEGRRLFPYLTVLENLRLGASTQRDRKKIEHDLDQVFGFFPRLAERLGQKASSMSGGEQQMLAIGRALMAGPKLLILDEPSLGLAPIIVRELGKIIARINQSGISVLLVEQNVTLAFELATYGYVLDAGRVMIQGSMQELRQNDQVTRAYLG